jgi:hypothetical protein
MAQKLWARFGAPGEFTSMHGPWCDDMHGTVVTPLISTMPFYLAR